MRECVHGPASCAGREDMDTGLDDSMNDDGRYGENHR